MRTISINLKSGLHRVAAAVLCVLVLALLGLFVKWTFGHAVAVNADVVEVSNLGVDFAPSDAHAHFNLAQLLEKTFQPEDQARALREFETAVALSPHDYTFWLALGRAREQSGDGAGAEQAYRKAAELAPNYSRVQWALGNALLRQGRQNEAFAEIRKAVAADGAFANPAATAAWQTFGGDVAKIKVAIGDSPKINASLAVLLAGEKRYAEALDFWRRSLSGDEHDARKESGQMLYGKLIEGGLYRSAIEVMSGFDSAAAVGTVSNGGFESPLTTQVPNPFAWAIAGGTYPSVGLNGNQKRSGNYSLLMNFGQGGKGFRPVSQKIAVEPAAAYELQFFYRSELTTANKIRCEVATAGGDLIASGDVSEKREWVEVRLSFSVPSGTEGVEIKINSSGCPAAGCAVAGNIWFDDFSLTKR